MAGDVDDRLPLLFQSCGGDDTPLMRCLSMVPLGATEWRYVAQYVQTQR